MASKGTTKGGTRNKFGATRLKDKKKKPKKK